MSPNTAPAITPDLVAAHGLKPDEYERIIKLIGRTPTFTELGIFSAMWNEHCSYKSSRIICATLPTSAPWVIQGPGENAGVIDIGDGHAVDVQDGEPQPSVLYRALPGRGDRCRRHPARCVHHGRAPHRHMNALRFGDPGPSENPASAWRAWWRASAAMAIASGCRPWAGRVIFHPRYNGNILVNAMTVGVAEADKIFYSAAAGVGNTVVYRRLENRARRHPWRDHGIRRIRRGLGGKTPDRAGGRPVHRKASDRGLP